MKAFLPLNRGGECLPLYETAISPYVGIVWIDTVPSMRQRAALRPQGSKTLIPQYLYLDDQGVQWFPAQLVLSEEIRRISHNDYVQQRMRLLMGLNGYEPTAAEVILRNGDIVSTEDWWAMLLAIGEVIETEPDFWLQLVKGAGPKKVVAPNDAQHIRIIARARGRHLRLTPSALEQALGCFVGKRAGRPASSAYPRAGLRYNCNNKAASQISAR